MRALALLACCACATTDVSILPTLPSQWQRPGTEDQYVLQRQLTMSPLEGQAGLSWSRYERRLHRRGGEFQVQVPVQPDRKVTKIALRTLSPTGVVGFRDLAHFVYTDRLGHPVLQPGPAAFLALKIDLEAGSLIDWAVEGVDRQPHWLPPLLLDGSWPIEEARLSITGDPQQWIEVEMRGLQPTVTQETQTRSYVVNKLGPHLAHPWSPHPLGERALRPRWRKPSSRDLVARMTGNPPVIYDLKPAPRLKGGLKASPCVLLPWDLKAPAPWEVLLATAVPRLEGGLEATVDPLVARGFPTCRLVEPGAPANVFVRPESGVAVFRFKTKIRDRRAWETEGQLSLAGLAAHAVRLGKLDPVHLLRARLGPKWSMEQMMITDQRMGPSGPITIHFRLGFHANELAPQYWLAKPYVALDWLRADSRFLGPLINEERIQWDFIFPTGSAPLPPTTSKTITEPELVGSATWSLGRVRTIRFVQELRWQLSPRNARPVELRRALDSLTLDPLTLELKNP